MAIQGVRLTKGRESDTSPAVVAFGGGHGLAASLSALRLLSERLTAIVTVADDGGSSGRLREELDVLPPGDLRMALAALCDNGEWGRTWRDILQHRFHTKGELDRHSVGNILIVAMWEILGDSVAGLDWAGRLLGARGRVLPMSSVPLAIEADVIGHDTDGNDVLTTVHGQSSVAKCGGRIAAIRLVPANPPAVPEAIQAIHEADWIVLGPGSWFTSVLPHLMVDELAQALHETSARLCVTMNLSTQEGETDGFSAADHLAALHAHAPNLKVDTVLADPASVDSVDDVVEIAETMGGHLVLRQVSVGEGIPQHDPLRLAAAYRDVFDDVLGDVE